LRGHGEFVRISAMAYWTMGTGVPRNRLRSQGDYLPALNKVTAGDQCSGKRSVILRWGCAESQGGMHCIARKALNTYGPPPRGQNLFHVEVRPLKMNFNPRWAPDPPAHGCSMIIRNNQTRSEDAGAVETGRSCDGPGRQKIRSNSRLARTK